MQMFVRDDGRLTGVAIVFFVCRHTTTDDRIRQEVHRKYKGEILTLSRIEDFVILNGKRVRRNGIEVEICNGNTD